MRGLSEPRGDGACRGVHELTLGSLPPDVPGEAGAKMRGGRSVKEDEAARQKVRKRRAKAAAVRWDLEGGEKQ